MKKLLSACVAVIVVLAAVLAWQYVSYKDDVKEFEYNRWLAGVSLLCGEVAGLSSGLLEDFGIESRLVAVLTEENWSYFSDGHTMLEIKRNGKWVLCGTMFGYFFKENGKYLSLYEVINAFKDDSTRLELEYFGKYIPEKEYPMKLMERLFQAPLIYDGGYWYTYSERAVLYSSGYIYVDETSWLNMFYGEDL